MDSDSDSDSSIDEGLGHSDEDSSSHGDDHYESRFIVDLMKVKSNNNHDVDELQAFGNYDILANMSNVEWRELGSLLSNYKHLTSLDLNEGALNDQRMMFLFGGLTASHSIKYLSICDNDLSTAAMRSIVPHTKRLQTLRLSDNNIQSEGFNIVFRALHSSLIRVLDCSNCSIESIEIDTNYIPRNLKGLILCLNKIGMDGCRELTKLLQGEDSTLEYLHLSENKIRDDGVAILVDALQDNKVLKGLFLGNNDGMSLNGSKLILRLLNNISSVEATLQSNHTLNNVDLNYSTNKEIWNEIDVALEINRMSKPNMAGREKLIETQLHSTARDKLAKFQGVDRSLFSQIDPLCLPELFSLIGNRHGHNDLYISLIASIAEVVSTVNREQCIKQKLAYYKAKTEELIAELAAIEEAKGRALENENECIRMSKRRRK